MIPQWFTLYMIAFNKTYSTGLHEAMRLVEEAMHHVDAHVPTSYRLALNPRSDMRRVHAPWSLPEHTAVQRRHLMSTPASFDWRDYMSFEPPTDQGRCNSCYAFAAAGVLEHWAQKLNKTVSTQHIMNCSPHPCGGGSIDHVFKWGGPYGVREPYLGLKRKCVAEGDLRVQGYEVVVGGVEAHLEQALTYGPVAVGVDSSSTHYNLYAGGTFTADACNKQIDHAMLVVGYTPDYWILRNSFGTHWGDGGYMHLERGRNACGIDTYATYVTEAT